MRFSTLASGAFFVLSSLFSTIAMAHPGHEGVQGYNHTMDHFVSLILIGLTVFILFLGFRMMSSSNRRRRTYRRRA